MKELEECLEALLAEVKPIEKTEYVALTDACDRILGEDIVAQMMIPPYPKSAMDGYAVRAEDTSGADREHPDTMRSSDRKIPIMAKNRYRSTGRLQREQIIAVWERTSVRVSRSLHGGRICVHSIWGFWQVSAFTRCRSVRG